MCGTFPLVSHCGFRDIYVQDADTDCRCYATAAQVGIAPILKHCGGQPTVFGVSGKHHCRCLTPRFEVLPCLPSHPLTACRLLRRRDKAKPKE